MPALDESSSSCVYQQVDHLRPRLIASISGYEVVGDHVEYTIVVTSKGKEIARSQQRYSAFVKLHDQLAGELSMRAFPVGKALLDTRSLRSSRVVSLGNYIDDVIRQISSSGKALSPILQDFLGINRADAIASGLFDTDDWG